MKKINVIILSVVVIAISAFTFNRVSNSTPEFTDDSKVKAGIYEANVKSSKVGWIGRKITSSHNGTVELERGSLEFDNNGLKGGSFELDMTTIKCLDLTDKKKNAKLVGHLKSDDFFSVEKHPKVTFVITSVKKQKKGTDNYDITGDLTIKGITHPLSFPAKIEGKGDKVNASATMKFDRAKYKVKFQSGSFFENLGDKAIYDDIEMDVALVTSK